MVSPTAARITWLLPDPEAREAYDVRHAGEADGEMSGECMRCGGLATLRGVGRRVPMVVSIRDRGTDWRNKEEAIIHKGCIPKGGERPQRIRARSLSASQVRATTGEKE